MSQGVFFLSTRFSSSLSHSNCGVYFTVMEDQYIVEVLKRKETTLSKED
jgi:hypothetical protein